MNHDLDKMMRIIETFSKEEHIHLLKIIIQKDAVALSENSNGTFVQMDEVSKETIDQMNRYIDYVLLKECDIKKMEEAKDRLKYNINE
jgi:hypothetical protein